MDGSLYRMTTLFVFAPFRQGGFRQFGIVDPAIRTFRTVSVLRNSHLRAG